MARVTNTADLAATFFSRFFRESDLRPVVQGWVDALPRTLSVTQFFHELALICCQQPWSLVVERDSLVLFGLPHWRVPFHALRKDVLSALYQLLRARFHGDETLFTVHHGDAAAMTLDAFRHDDLLNDTRLRQRFLAVVSGVLSRLRRDAATQSVLRTRLCSSLLDVEDRLGIRRSLLDTIVDGTDDEV